QGLRKADRKWITGNRRLIIADSANRRCRGVAALGLARVTKLRDDPEMMFSPDAVRQWYEHSQTRKSAVVDVAVDGQAPKWCCATANRSIKPRLANRRFGARSPSWRIWEAGHALLRRSLRCPQPLLFVEFTSDLGMHHQYLLTEAVPNASRLSDFLAACGSLSPTDRERMLERCLNRLALDVRRMFVRGIDHRALNAQNVLVSATGDACEIYFWGLEAVRVRLRLTPKQVMTSLASLNVSVPASLHVRLSHRLRFLRRLLQNRICGTLSKTGWKNAWREIARESALLPAGENEACRAFPYC
ncbi:MAG: lipopolysaccharide kinase InaA family protein, partial [Planctomycetaceae bacterium]